MKNGRWLVVGALVICMAGCGIFFAPLEGRWNPLDPDFGAGFTKDIELWDNYLAAMLFVGFVAFEWAWRRKRNLA